MAAGTKFRVRFDEKKVRQIVNDAGMKGLLSLMHDVLKRVGDFIPEDTGAMRKQAYLVRGADYFILGYGSLSGDEAVNEAVVRQHEEALNHYGFPKGKSMREGVVGSNIPGIAWAVAGHSRNKGDGELLRQYEDYWHGYFQKLTTGQLQRYPTQFLTKALEQALKSWKKHFGK